MKLLLLSSLLIATNSYSLNMKCLSSSSGKVKYINNKKEVIINESYCFKKGTPQIESISCLSDCEAKKFKTFKTTFKGNIGSPGFKLCKKGYIGRPQILKYWDGYKWVGTSRCLFDDGSFIDIGRLEQRSTFSN